MTREECSEVVSIVYQEYYRQITLNSDYVLPKNLMNDRALNSFCDYIDKSVGLKRVGLDWIIEFVELSFHWWYKSNHLKFGLSSIKLNWIIGKNSIERFDKVKNKHYILTFFKKEIRVKVGLSVRNKLKLKSSTILEANRNWLLELSEDEENFKKQFYNKPEGLLWCVSNTTLFNHKSELCQKCNNRSRCKEILKKNMPRLFKLRGYLEE